jgi:hypothetical protein
MFRVHILKEMRSTNVRWLCDHSRFLFFFLRAVLTHKNNVSCLRIGIMSLVHLFVNHFNDNAEGIISAVKDDETIDVV